MPVHTHLHGPVAVLTLDRPDKRNAFDAALTLALDTALNAFEDDAALRVAVLTGGTDFFSAGTDVVAWAGEPTERGGPYGITGRRLRKPIIAAVEGIAAGGGFEIALSTSMIVASTTASFSLPEVRLGLIAECGGLFRGPRALPINIARELLLTGVPLGADRAHALGLVNRLTAPSQALPEALALARQIADRAPLAVRETLTALEGLYADTDALGWALTQQAKAVVRESADSREGVAAFKARRPPRWQSQ